MHEVCLFNENNPMGGGRLHGWTAWLRWGIWLGLLLGILLWGGTAKAGPQPQITPFQAAILEPRPGQALQGNVTISGNSAIPRFQSAEISFSYAQDPTQTWFLIQRSNVGVAGGVLAQWDTSTISDGDYNLRLLIRLTNGNEVMVVVEGLRVRNYTPIETDTPTPAPVSPTPPPETLGEVAPSPTPTVSPTPIPPSPTALPTNPAEITGRQIAASLGVGASAAAGGLLLVGIYLSLQKVFRR